MIIRIDRCTVAAAAVIAFLAVACAEPGNAQTISEKGAWKIAASPNANAARDNFSLSTRALDQTGARFSLSCRQDVALYYFAVETGSSASPRPEDVARFSIRVTDQDPIWFQTGWRDGGVEVREGAHQTAFSIIMTLLTDAKSVTVEFAVDGQQRTFSLDGFADLKAELRRHCGHDFASGPAPR
jgi:hypothetical protein